MHPHRIAAGGIVLKEDAILLVRYGTADVGSYLVGPGGALDSGENAVQAIIREAMEETGVLVRPRRVLWIEDLQCSRFKMCKIWMLCDLVSGDVRPTDGARAEGITEAGWFRKSQLEDEVVYPPPVMHHDWDEFRSEHWEVQCLPSRIASF
ncbi:MAG: NUDIX domain-containing protein [Anaerolineae bacterium]|jgi:8-oxo-dGTP diphosphatase